MYYIIIGAIITLSYIWLMLRFYAAYRRLQPISYNIKKQYALSVIVAARNEEANITRLLDSLREQDYDPRKYEIILVDDHSSDKTISLIKQHQKQYPDFSLKVITLEGETASGKKKALSVGIEKARGEVLCFTDADCIPDKEWLSSINQAYQNTGNQMHLGGVRYSNTSSLFEILQALEFNSLQASTAAAVGMHHPIMCNGANLSIRKSAYAMIKDRIGGQRFASGDDIFLLHTVKKHFGGKSISYSQLTQACVITQGASNINELIQQRARWAGKSKAYTDSFTISVALIVFFFNLFFTACMILSPCSKQLLFTYLSLFLVKSLAEFPLMYSYHKKIDQLPLMKTFLLIQPLYPLYIVASASIGLFRPTFWKGRKTK